MDNGEARFEGRKGIELRFAPSPMMCDDDDFLPLHRKHFVRFCVVYQVN